MALFEQGTNYLVSYPFIFRYFCMLDQISKAQSLQAICKQVKTIAEPIIAEQIPNYKIDSVQFEVLSLGSLPPAFTGWTVLFFFSHSTDTHIGHI